MLNVNVSNPKDLSVAIQSVAKFANNHPHNTLPTQNIMVETIDNGLRLTATDLHTSVEFGVNSSDVLGEGEFCIKATTLKKLGEIVKDQSGIGLEQTETGVNLTIADAPTFLAKFETTETGEFPMTAKPNEKAHWIELNAEHVATLKKLVKYADTKQRGRVGYDALQFAMQPESDWLYAYTTDGGIVAFAKLGRTSDIENFAIPMDALKKAFQVANTPDLKNSAWRLTLPSEDSDVISIQVADTAVKVRAGEALDLTEFIERHVTHNGDDDDYIAFNPKALTNGVKKVSKLFMRDAKFENIVIIEGNPDGNLTMTAKVVKKRMFGSSPSEAVDMQAEYVHSFDADAAECVTSANHFRILVEGKRLETMVRDVSSWKPNIISVELKKGIPDKDGEARYDAVVIAGTPNSPLGFLANPAKL